MILAEVAADPQISGNWIIALIGAVAAGISLVIGKKQGRAEAEENNVTLKQPLPTFPMSKVSTPPSWDAHTALDRRVFALEAQFVRLDDEIKAMRREQGEQFTKLMQAGAERENRLADKIDELISKTHSRIDALISNTPPRPRTR